METGGRSIIVQTQNEQAAMLISLRADIETLTLVVSVLAPQFAANLTKALESNRERYIHDLAQRQAKIHGWPMKP